VDRITILVNGSPIEVERGTSVAAALLNSRIWGFRQAVNGEPRGPICAMGICFECRVTIDGIAHRRSCMVPCEAGMEVDTSG
jgi:sarcosine oxidase subunit alpha